MKKLLSTLFLFIKNYGIGFLSFFAVVIVIRLLEYTFYASDFELSKSTFRGFTYSLEYDFIFAGAFFIGALPFFYLLFLASKKLYSVVFYFVYGLLILFNLIFLAFFHTLHTLPGAILFQFSLSELLEVVSTEWNTTIGNFGGIILGTALSAFLLPVLLGKLDAKTKYTSIAGLGTLILCLALGLGRGVMQPDPEKYDSRAEFNLYQSKWTYFSLNTIEYLTGGETPESQIPKAITRFRTAMGYPKSGDMFTAPFSRITTLHHAPDWNTYIDVKDSMNVVVVFAEGLSASFTGPNAAFGSLTPTLDSLIAGGLFWPNMLSISDRTHGIFSSALAGLPHGFERGFLNINTVYPDHLSVLNRFSNRGYSTAFAYGGWSYFDNYRQFLEHQGTDFFYDQDFLQDTFNIQPETFNNEAHVWGFKDHRMAELYFSSMDLVKQPTPYFNIFLTLSLHSPFDIPDEEYYFQKAKKLKPKFPEAFITKKQKELATVLYTDAFFKDFFDRYSQRPEFENTVFLIFGDHNVHGIKYKNELDRYHVPFLIYSPAVKKPATFREIISHNDVPAILSSLFNLELPRRVHWKGRGAQAADETSAAHPIFLGSFTGRLTGVLHEKTLLLYDKLYSVEEGLELTPLNDSVKKEKLRQLLADYETLNRYTIENNLILSNDTRLWLERTREVTSSNLQ